jgi:hypothetical protein
VVADVEQLRALAQRWKDAATAEVARVGVAGAVLEGIRSGCATELLALLDSLPVSVAPREAELGQAFLAGCDHCDGWLDEKSRMQHGMESDSVFAAEYSRGRDAESQPAQQALTADEVRGVLGECGILTSHGNAELVAQKLAGRAVGLPDDERAALVDFRRLASNGTGVIIGTVALRGLDRLLATEPRS